MRDRSSIPACRHVRAPCWIRSRLYLTAPLRCRPRKASRERRQSGSRGKRTVYANGYWSHRPGLLRSRTSDRDKIPNLHCSGSYRHWHFLPDCDPERRSNPRWLFDQYSPYSVNKERSQWPSGADHDRYRHLVSWLYPPHEVLLSFQTHPSRHWGVPCAVRGS